MTAQEQKCASIMEHRQNCDDSKSPFKNQAELARCRCTPYDIYESQFGLLTNHI